MGTPIDDAAALVNEALIIQLAEGLPHRPRTALVHGKATAIPVAGGAHLHLLLHDAIAIFLLPVPDPLQEFFAAQIVASKPFLLAQGLLHLDLGGNAGMVGAWKPQGLVALHPLKAGEDVLKRGVKRVAHVKLSRNIGRGHYDGKRFFIRIGLGLEASAVHPHFIDPRLHIPGIIDLGQFFSHDKNLLLGIWQNKRPAPFCHKSKTGRTINTVRGTTCVRGSSPRTRKPITAAAAAAYLRWAAELRSDFLPALTEAHTYRSLSLHSVRKYYSSSLFFQYEVILLYLPTEVKSIWHRRNRKKINTPIKSGFLQATSFL